jgi:hypothetical protein
MNGEDVRNVTLALQPAGEIFGKLTIAGQPPDRPLPQTFRVTIQGLESATTTDQYGNFRFSDKEPSRYAVRVIALPENAYLDHVAFDGVDAASGGFDLASGVRNHALTVAIGLNGGAIAGTVTRNVSVGNSVNVYLMRRDLEQPADVFSVFGNGESRYEFRALRPGVYRVFAVEAADMNFETRKEYLDALRLLALQAHEIEIRAGDRIDRTLATVAVEKVHAPRIY